MAQSSSKRGNEDDNIKNLLNKCTEFVAATPDDWFRQLFEIIERNFEGRLPNGGFEALTPIYAMNFGPTDLSVPKFINKYVRSLNFEKHY
uniref:Uncharacterized protein n=1 Tax=Sarcoptes scabiei TaxID=52283 RepID=A0A834RFQ8_SARSC